VYQSLLWGSPSPNYAANFCVQSPLGVIIAAYCRHLTQETQGVCQGVIMHQRRHHLLPQGDNWLEAFTTSLRHADLRPRTVAGYRDDLTQFWRWFQHTHGPRASLQTLHASDLVHDRHQLLHVKHLQPATINRHLQALRRWCRWALRCGVLTHDPTQELKTLRTPHVYQPLGLHEAEVHALLRVAGASPHGLSRRNYALVQLMVHTGVRVSEVAALSVGDLMLYDRSGAVCIRDGKGRKARSVPLNATARRALRLYLETREFPPPTAALWASKRGTPMTIRAIQAVIAALAQRARLTRVRVSPHTLRHSFALTYLKQNPGKLVELATLLGHDSLDTTALYTRPSTEELAADLERSPLNVSG
jgi:site-specific recombinase XerD